MTASFKKSLDPLHMNGKMPHVAIKAGEHGVIARGSWGRNQGVVVVVSARQTEQGMRMVLVSIAPDRFGNYDPTDADLKAQDWYIVSQSRNKHTR